MRAVRKKVNYKKFGKALAREYSSGFRAFSTLESMNLEPKQFLKDGKFAEEKINEFLKSLEALCSENSSLSKAKICFAVNGVVSSEGIRPQKASKGVFSKLKRLENELDWFNKTFPGAPIFLDGVQISSEKATGSLKALIHSLKGFAQRHIKSGRRGPVPNYFKNFSLSILFLELIEGGINSESAYLEIAILIGKLKGTSPHKLFAEANKIKSQIAEERRRLKA